MPERPECLAILICESVVEDRFTRNKSIFNTFNGIQAPKFPVRQDRLTVFISLTNGNGKLPMKLCFVKASTNEVLFHLEGEVDFQNPLQVHEVGIDMRNVLIPEAGSYSIQLHVGGELIRERRFRAMLFEKKGENK